MSSAYYPQIWQTIRQIPPGKVASYGQIADLAGLPRRARLVGKALGYAPAQLALPWYRVIRSDRRLGFAPGSSQTNSTTSWQQSRYGSSVSWCSSFQLWDEVSVRRACIACVRAVQCFVKLHEVPTTHKGLPAPTATEAASEEPAREIDKLDEAHRIN